MQETLTISSGNGLVIGNAITDDLFTSFIAYLDVTQKSIETYAKAIRHFSGYLACNGISRPTRQNIIDYREQLKTTHKATTVNLYIIATRLFFQWTEQQGIYPNIAEHIKGVKVSREPKKDALTVEQITDILSGINTATVQGLRDYAIIVTAITCGLRTIEISRLKIKDIRQSGNNLVLDVQGKGRDDTEPVKLPLKTYKAILNYLATREDADENQPLFTSCSNKNNGAELTTRSVSRIIKNAFINSGYNTDHLTAHSCRHTAVTLALLNNEDIQAVKDFARHKNITTTLIYAHNLDMANNTCSNTIADAIL